MGKKTKVNLRAAETRASAENTKQTIERPETINVQSGDRDKLNMKALRKKNRAQKERERKWRKYGIVPSANNMHQSVKKTLITPVLHRWLSLLLVGAITFLMSATYFYAQSEDQASTVLMLNYQESAKGLNPNGTRFSIRALRSHEVLDNAIDYAGLTGQVSAQEIANNLYVSEVYTRDASDEDYYIVTSYVITYYMPERAGAVTADNMLDMICRAYEEYFFSEYGPNTAVVNGDYSEIEEMEYREIGSLFFLRYSQIDGYLKMRLNEQKVFSDSEGNSFADIRKQLNNLKDYQLADYNAYVWENGVVKDSNMYKATLEYINSKLQEAYDIAMSEHDIRKNVLQEFSDIMATSILIPTYNNKNDFYMSRTKTGVDYLASEGNAFLKEAETLETKILQNNDRISKVPYATSNVHQQRAEQMVKEIITELQRIESVLLKTDSEYNAQKTRNYLTFKDRTPSILSRISYKKAFLLAFVVCFAMYLVFYREYSRALKESRLQQA